MNRIKYPIPGKIKEITFPNYNKFLLSNGIKFIYVKNESSPLYGLRFYVNSGSYEDSFVGNDKTGTANLAAELLHRGTEKNDALKIASEIDYYGLLINSGANYDYSFLSSFVLGKYFDKVFDLLIEIIFQPTFLFPEIKKKKIQLENILRSYKDDVSYLAKRVFLKNLYGKCPYAEDDEGTLTSIPNIGRNDLFSYHKKFYIPENLLISLTADLEPDEAFKLIDYKLGHLKMFNPEVCRKFCDYPSSQSNNIFIINKDEAVQSSIVVGQKSIRRNHKDFLKMALLNTILGGCFTSRINLNLRESKGLTYGARSILNGRKFGGDFYVETDVSNQVTAKAVKEIINEFKNLTEKEIGKDEIETAKNFLIGNFAMQFENSDSVADLVLNSEIFGLGEDDFLNYSDNIKSISADDLYETAEKYIGKDSLIISVAGNAEEITEQLEKIGVVKIIKDI